MWKNIISQLNKSILSNWKWLLAGFAGSIFGKLFL